MTEINKSHLSFDLDTTGLEMFLHDNTIPAMPTKYHTQINELNQGINDNYPDLLHNTTTKHLDSPGSSSFDSSISGETRRNIEYLAQDLDTTGTDNRSQVEYIESDEETNSETESDTQENKSGIGPIRTDGIIQPNYNQMPNFTAPTFNGTRNGVLVGNSYYPYNQQFSSSQEQNLMFKRNYMPTVSFGLNGSQTMPRNSDFDERIKSQSYFVSKRQKMHEMGADLCYQRYHNQAVNRSPVVYLPVFPQTNQAYPNAIGNYNFCNQPIGFQQQQQPYGPWNVPTNMYTNSYNPHLPGTSGWNQDRVSDLINNSDQEMPPIIDVDGPITKRKYTRRNIEGRNTRERLPEFLAKNLDIIFIGINPGCTTKNGSQQYTAPTNHFWKCLNASGLIPCHLSANDSSKLIDYGIGITHIVNGARKGCNYYRRGEINEGTEALNKKLKELKPKIAVFNGKMIYKAYSGKTEFNYGKQPECIEGSNIFIWVMPSSRTISSIHPPIDDKYFFFKKLKSFCDYVKGKILVLPDIEVIFPSSLFSIRNNVL